LRTLGDNLPECAIYLYSQDANGTPRVEFVSAGIERLTGVPAAEYMADAAAVDRNIAPEDLDRMNAAIAVSRERLTLFEVEVRHIHRVTGETRWSLMRSTPTRRPDGSTVWEGIELDITDRKRAEEALRESERNARRSEEHYRLLHDTMLQGVVYQDAEGKILSINPAAQTILGKTPEEFLGSTSVEQDPGTIREDGSPFPGLEHPSMVALATGREVRNVPMAVYNPREKRYRWIDISAVPLFRPGEEKPYQVYTIFEDITERKRAAEAVRQASEQRRLALEAARLGAWDYRFDTGDVFWDERCRDLFGIQSGVRIDYDDAIGCIHPEDRAAVDAAVQRALAGADGGAYHREFRVVWPDGSEHWVDSYGRVYFAGEGEQRRAVRFIGVNLDVT
jgi:hypothetical protein